MNGRIIFHLIIYPMNLLGEWAINFPSYYILYEAPWVNGRIIFHLIIFCMNLLGEWANNFPAYYILYEASGIQGPYQNLGTQMRKISTPTSRWVSKALRNTVTQLCAKQFIYYTLRCHNTHNIKDFRARMTMWYYLARQS